MLAESYSNQANLTEHHPQRTRMPFHSVSRLHLNTLYKPMSTPTRPSNQIHPEVAHDSRKILTHFTLSAAPYSRPLTNNCQPEESPRLGVSLTTRHLFVESSSN